MRNGENSATATTVEPAGARRSVKSAEVAPGYLPDESAGRRTGNYAGAVTIALSASAIRDFASRTASAALSA